MPTLPFKLSSRITFHEVGGAENAALLAVQILALSDARLATALAEHKLELARGVAAKSEALQRKLGAAAP